MANEYFYNISLSIVHPTVNPITISASIANLRPRIESMAGSERRGKDGKPLIPSRKTMFSHWSADLHKEEKIFSGTTPISAFILDQLQKLEPNRDLFWQLRKAGEVLMVICWFSESNYSADVLTAEVLGKCGDLGIDIELDFYALDSHQTSESPVVQSDDSSM